MMLTLGLILLTFVILIWLTARKRTKLVINGFEVYQINKGRHYSFKVGSLIPLMFKFEIVPKTMRFEVIFGNGCDYHDQDYDHLNKLYGISYGFDNHYRSIRIAWKYNANLKVIELYSYAYVDGKRKIQLLGHVQQFDVISCMIYNPGDDRSDVIQVLAVCDDGKTTIGINTIPFRHRDTWLRFKQFPYFGGVPKAPHDIKILIKDL